MEMLLPADIFPGPVLKHPPPGWLKTYKKNIDFLASLANDDDDDDDDGGGGGGGGDDDDDDDDDEVEDGDQKVEDYEKNDYDNGDEYIEVYNDDNKNVI